ncbi:SMP-30/gluconolactonase/LRE family protein [Streptomyces olivaceus]|uniref:SMP-30/gluconolactonase/LRE family protein n=1 Tax=Streptomyces olivaceus TaxID=47716 RepID=UPI001885411C|nr:SMP-30/gluconolactonase/LRE family protein [Streptomyces olivaceus]
MTTPSGRAAAPTATARTVLDGLHFAESPSVGPDGALYVSDFYDHAVLRIDPRTWRAEPWAEVPGQPSGLGWLPDGRLLVVSMRDRRLLRREADGTLVTHADLAAATAGAANDMYVDAEGRAWVGDFGFDFYGLLRGDPEADPLFGPDADPPTARLTRVDPDGTVTTVARGLRFPNGTTLLPDGTLVVAETVGGCLTAFTVTEDGELTGRRMWADLSSAGPSGDRILPDGIAHAGGERVWVSDPTAGGASRVARGGEVDARVRTSQPCFAVGVLPTRPATVVCCTAATSNPTTAAAHRTGRIETAHVPEAAG